LDIIVRFNLDLARETEDLDLEPERVRAGVEALLGDPSKGLYFVAEQACRVIGQVLITHEWSDWRNGDIWWLQSVYVDRDLRRQGVFTALFEFVLDAASRRTDVRGLRLYMEADNDRARAAYARLGMKETNYLVFERIVTPGKVHAAK
jgi:GNAT superfamily N-acetyltransferase